MMRILTAALLATGLLVLSACDMPDKKEARVGSLVQHLTMVDAEGKIYGAVELDPINGGKLFDAQGRLIGRIVSPGNPVIAPTAQ